MHRISVKLAFGRCEKNVLGYKKLQGGAGGKKALRGRQKIVSNF